MSKRIPDEAWVVRCGRPPYERPVPLHERCEPHEGVFGFSVQCAAEAAVTALAQACRDNKIGVTTVGEIRALGYDVVVTSGRGHHATVVVPEDWDRDAAALLGCLFREQANPSRGETG